MARLKRVDCSKAGLTRRRRGKGFVYVDDCGNHITDPIVIERIKSLVIPPAWKDVWICSDANGHIQATGLDAKGRRQYWYHPSWREHRDREKFAHMVDFGRALPELRDQLNHHMARPDLDYQRVLAASVRLLDHGFFRIGGEDYAEQNGSYGLATMRKSYVRLHEHSVEFEYTAKSGKHRLQSIADPEVVEIVQHLKRRRSGTELLAYRKGKQWKDVKSSDINDYVKAISGKAFSAKDFRTWNATVLMAVGLAVPFADKPSETTRKRLISRAVKEVSGYLGNTPAVCRSSYIDPRVIDRFHHGETISDALDEIGSDTPYGSPATQGHVEAAVLELIV